MDIQTHVMAVRWILNALMGEVCTPFIPEWLVTAKYVKLCMCFLKELLHFVWIF